MEADIGSFSLFILLHRVVYNLNMSLIFLCELMRVSKGWAFGACAPPPLEPNAQRKNLRRLKDLRGPIQRKSPKLST